jgi:MFS family permease
MTADISIGAARALPRRSVGGLIAISIFWFALTFHWSALQLILVPSQVRALLFLAAPAGTIAAQAQWAKDHGDLTLAIVAAPGLIVALIGNPFFGLLSDRTPGRFGRRRPYILGGTALNVLGLAVMALAPMTLAGGHTGNPLGPSILVLMAGLMLTQFANNCAAAPFHALLPDLVPEEQRGLASGIMGVALLLGQIGGALAPILFGIDAETVQEGHRGLVAYNTAVLGAYATVAVVIMLMATLTALTVRERPWTRQAAVAYTVGATRMWRDLLLTVAVVLVVAAGGLVLIRASLGFDLGADSPQRLKSLVNSVNVLQLVGVVVAGIGAARAFDFRPRRNPDFTWVVVTRMLVMMGIYIVQNFLQFYMADVAHARPAETATTIFIIILTVTAALSTAFAGWGSDRFGRKRMVYISGGFMAAVGAAFVLAPYLVPSQVLMVAYVAAAVFGLGYGAYVAVDWALVADVLPSEATFARDMGVWNIGLTIPQVLALVFGAWILDDLGPALGSRSLGFTALFVTFVIFCVLGTVTVRYIKGVR